MVVRGQDGSQLGVVERFEIDEHGQLTGVIARHSASGACKRVGAALIRGIRRGALTIGLSSAEFSGLPDAGPRDDALPFDDRAAWPNARIGG